ncbi:MAG: IS630 family transposase [Calditrichota bacterium]
MSRTSPKIELTAVELKDLSSRVSSGKTEQRFAFRAKIILQASEGSENKDIASSLETTPATVGKWRKRFAKQRLEGLKDSPRPGIAPTYREDTEKRVLQMLDQPVPAGYGVWTGSLLAKELKDVSDDKVWRILRKHKISLSKRHSWCISNDPEFEEKAAAIIGLYLDPPENAIVLSVDEKPAIQALERDQGYLKTPPGQAITGYSHEI